MFLIGLLVQNFQQIQQLQFLISGSWVFVHSIFLPCVFLSASIIPHLMSKCTDIKEKFFRIILPTAFKVTVRRIIASRFNDKFIIFSSSSIKNA